MGVSVAVTVQAGVWAEIEVKAEMEADKLCGVGWPPRLLSRPDSPPHSYRNGAEGADPC